MARKESITKQIISDTAFVLMREEGIEEVTARKLAAKIGCSTQPIFRVYENMNELLKEVFERAAEAFSDYYAKCPMQNAMPFVDMGVAYIAFAREEKNLFSLLFLSEERHGRGMYELLNGQAGAVTAEIKKAQAGGCKAPGKLFMKMWIFIHGAACMTITGDYDLGEEETIQLLQESYKAYVGIQG